MCMENFLLPSHDGHWRVVKGTSGKFRYGVFSRTPSFLGSACVFLAICPVMFGSLLACLLLLFAKKRNAEGLWAYSHHGARLPPYPLGKSCSGPLDKKKSKDSEKKQTPVLPWFSDPKHV